MGCCLERVPALGEAMINVEGNYEEILEWMDNYPVREIQYNSHGEWISGTDEDGRVERAQLNFGLFSLVPSEDTHEINYRCGICVGGTSTFFKYVHDIEHAENVITSSRWGVELAPDPTLVRF
jgi:hypothetical protein